MKINSKYFSGIGLSKLIKYNSLSKYFSKYSLYDDLGKFFINFLNLI